MPRFADASAIPYCGAREAGLGRFGDTTQGWFVRHFFIALFFSAALFCGEGGGSGSDLDVWGLPRAHKMCQSSSGHHTARSDTPMHGTRAARMLEKLETLVALEELWEWCIQHNWNKNLRVFWKLMNLRECVWEIRYRITMKITLQEKETIHNSIAILVHKFIPVPQAMKIPAAKAAVDEEWEKLEKFRRGT